MYSQARKEIEAVKLVSHLANNAKRVVADRLQPASTRRTKLAALTVGGAKLQDLSLDFTLPGYNIELKESCFAIQLTRTDGRTA